jgi:hypothetical protein
MFRLLYDKALLAHSAGVDTRRLVRISTEERKLGVLAGASRQGPEPPGRALLFAPTEKRRSAAPKEGQSWGSGCCRWLPL